MYTTVFTKYISILSILFYSPKSSQPVLQKRVVRLMTFKDAFPLDPGPLCHTEPIFQNLKILKIVDIYKYQILKFIFKTLKKLTPSQFHNWFIVNSERHNYRTRSNFNADTVYCNRTLFVPSARTTNYGLKQLKVNGPRIWNELPSNVRNESSLFIFMKSIISYLLSSYS